jgi:hypothetical protein
MNDRSSNPEKLKSSPKVRYAIPCCCELLSTQSQLTPTGDTGGDAADAPPVPAKPPHNSTQAAPREAKSVANVVFIVFQAAGLLLGVVR